MSGRPNILLLLFDSLGAAELERNLDALPNLRALRARSVAFTNAHPPCPESGPARATLFTGLDMASHGVWTDGVALPAHEVTLPQRFAGAGYRTWLVGRRQLAGVSNWTTEHARSGEYAHLDWAHGPLHRSRQNAYLAWLKDVDPDSYARIFPRQPDPDDTHIPPEQRAALRDLPDGLSFNHWIGARMVRHLGGPTTQPILGIAGFVVGDRLGAPMGNGPQLDRVDPQALIQADAAIGAILDAARDVPDVVIALASARGSLTADDPRPMQRDLLHVPLMICGARDPATREAIVSTMDLAPTLYEIAGVPPSPRIQGRSLLSEDPRGWALARLRHPDAPHQTALTTDRWKLLVTHGTDGGEVLYDPTDEARDLAADPAHHVTLDALRDTMIDARVALEDRTEPRTALF